MVIGGRDKEISEGEKLLDARRAERELRLFTNRDDERLILNGFLQTVATDNVQLEQPIMSIWGAGGVGKSSLLSCVWNEFKQENPESTLHLVNLNLDADKTEAISPMELLRKLRLQLFHDFGVHFYLFDTLFLKYKQISNEPISLEDCPVMASIESEEDKSEIRAVINADAGQLANVSKILNALAKISGWGWDKQKVEDISKRLNLTLDEVEIMYDSKKLEGLLAKVFAEELATYLQEHKRTLCIALDGYERIPKVVEKLLVEGLITSILSDENHLPHIGFLFLGSNKLDWSDYDALQKDFFADESGWPSFIDSYHLGGLNQDSAEQFINAAIKLYREEQNTVCADMLEKYRTEIVAVTLEQEQAGATAHYPFYLDLCLQAVECHGSDFDPASHFGKTPKDLTSQILKYMGDEERDWHCAFALANEFDEELFGYLIDQKAISGNRQGFQNFVSNRSYVTRQKDTDSYRFHSLMQESLIADIASKDQSRRQGLRSSVADKLIDFYNIIFSDHNPGSLTDIECYARANAMLISAVKSGVVDLDHAYGKQREWDGLFKDSFFPLREAWARKWLELHQNILGDRHPAVAISLNDLAAVLQSQNMYPEAEALYREALAINRELLGDRHPDVVVSLNNLAAVLQLQEINEAEVLYREALAINRELLGDRHLDVVANLNNLAVALQSQELHEEAASLYQESLEINRELLGDRHPDVALGLNNLAYNLQSQGLYEEAEAMYREALAMNRELLGNRHPAVVLSLNSLAFNLKSQGIYDEAKDLYQESLATNRELLGDRHQDVAFSQNELAAVLQSQGMLAEAEPLYRESLKIKSELLGEAHPLVIGSLNNLAYVLRAQDKRKEAAALNPKSAIA